MNCKKIRLIVNCQKHSKQRFLVFEYDLPSVLQCNLFKNPICTLCQLILQFFKFCLHTLYYILGYSLFVHVNKSKIVILYKFLCHLTIAKFTIVKTLLTDTRHVLLMAALTKSHFYVPVSSQLELWTLFLPPESVLTQVLLQYLLYLHYFIASQK